MRSLWIARPSLGRARARGEPSGGPPPPQAKEIAQHLERMWHRRHPRGFDVTPTNTDLVDGITPGSSEHEQLDIVRKSIQPLDHREVTGQFTGEELEAALRVVYIAEG
jgi:hypothetical protein